jgi:hypothetical protein
MERPELANANEMVHSLQEESCQHKETPKVVEGLVAKVIMRVTYREVLLVCDQ